MKIIINDWAFHNVIDVTYFKLEVIANDTGVTLRLMREPRCYTTISVSPSADIYLSTDNGLMINIGLNDCYALSTQNRVFDINGNPFIVKPFEDKILEFERR